MAENAPVLSLAQNAQAADQGLALLSNRPLNELTETSRFRELDTMERYLRNTQYDHLMYDWNGNLQGYGGEADIHPGWYVPLKRRKPNVRASLAKTVVGRFTSLLLGRDRWPEVSIDGDEDAEDYAKELVKASKLQSRLIEGRNLGGAQGTACVSFAFVKGKPRVQVHNAKNITVLKWADPSAMVIGSAVEAYCFKKRVWGTDGKNKLKDFYYVRYWDETREILWKLIPAELGRQRGWTSQPRSGETVHGFGFCPLYWIQNLPCSFDGDGEGDFDGETETIDGYNRLLSATHKGTVANVDPTLVVKMDPVRNDGMVKKGSGNAIFSTGGAEYLEVSGNAVRAAKELLAEEKGAFLEAVQCVLMNPSDSKAGVVSGEALRLRYAPMLSKLDLLRTQYGDAIQLIVQDMLKAARVILARHATRTQGLSGQPVDVVSSIDLPPKTVTEEIHDADTGEEQTITRKVKRDPGTAEHVSLKWGPYFPHTWADTEKAVGAAKNASGGKAVISHKTAVKLVSSLTGVEDVDAEMEQIDEDAEVSAERAQRAFGGPEPNAAPGPPKASAVPLPPPK